MKLFGLEAEGHQKALVILVAILLAAGGLCGAQYLILQYHQQGEAPLLLFFAFTGVLELGVMGGALGGIALVLVAWLISVLTTANAKLEEKNIQLGSGPEKPRVDRPNGTDQDKTE